MVPAVINPKVIKDIYELSSKLNKRGSVLHGLAFDNHDVLGYGTDEEADGYVSYNLKALLWGALQGFYSNGYGYSVYSGPGLSPVYYASGSGSYKVGCAPCTEDLLMGMQLDVADSVPWYNSNITGLGGVRFVMVLPGNVVALCGGGSSSSSYTAGGVMLVGNTGNDVVGSPQFCDSANTYSWSCPSGSTCLGDGYVVPVVYSQFNFNVPANTLFYACLGILS